MIPTQLRAFFEEQHLNYEHLCQEGTKGPGSYYDGYQDALFEARRFFVQNHLWTELVQQVWQSVRYQVDLYTSCRGSQGYNRGQEDAWRNLSQCT